MKKKKVFKYRLVLEFETSAEIRTYNNSLVQWDSSLGYFVKGKKGEQVESIYHYGDTDIQLTQLGVRTTLDDEE